MSPAMAIATLGGIGRLKPAPGTWGSAAVLPAALLGPGWALGLAAVVGVVGWMALRDLVRALGAAAVTFGSELGVPSAGAAHGKDLVGVGGDQDVGWRQHSRFGRSAVHPSHHRLAANFAQRFARQARGTKSRGDDGENSHEEFVIGNW